MKNLEPTAEISGSDAAPAVFTNATMTARSREMVCIVHRVRDASDVVWSFRWIQSRTVDAFQDVVWFGVQRMFVEEKSK